MHLLKKLPIPIGLAALTQSLSLLFATSFMLHAQCVSAPSGLIGWWPAEGNANDIVGTHNGTLQAGTTFASGEDGQAFSFSGSSPSSVLIPYAPALITPAYTVEAWVKPTAQVDGEGQSLIFGQPNGHVQLVVRTGTTGVLVSLQFAVDPSTFYNVQSTVEIPINQFTYVAGTWNGTNLSLYINGVLNTQTAPGAAPTDSGCDFCMGGFYGSCGYVQQFFQGLIDELGYYNRALSSSEVQSIYTANSAGKCPPTSLTPMTVVVPNYLATNDYSFGGGTLNVSQRSQEVYGAAEFPTNPIVITELRFRPNINGVTPFSTTISNIEVHLSTTGTYWDQLNSTFATNVGANDTIVFQGALTISSAVTGPVNGPKDFDIIVPLTTPFVYNPTAGNLLLDIRNYTGSGSASVYLSGSANGSDDCSRAVAVGNPDSTTTSFQDSGIDALEVVYQPTNVAVVAPVITQQPQSRTNLMGTTATFTVTATGTAPLNYQWSQNGTDLLNSTNATLTLTNVQPGQAGNYSVRISNIAGFTNSIAVVLTVLMPSPNAIKLVVPNYLATNDYNFGGGTLIQVLRSQEVYGAAEFPTNPIVITELRFRPNNVNVAPFSTTITNIEVHLSTTGAHWDQLNNTFATNVGINDTIVFQGALNISSQVTGPVGGPKDFDIIVPLTTPFVYNPAMGNLMLDIRNYNGTGSIITGLGGSASSSDDCSRAVAVGNPDSTTTSFQDSGIDALEVVYQPPVLISQQPLNQTNIAGMTAMFTVGATSLYPLTYQWQKNGTNLTNGGRISGATGTTLTIANVSTTDTANYRVIVSSPFSSTTSSNALLKVLDVHSAIVTPTVINGFVVGVDLVDGGYGYTNAPKVRLIGGGGSGAQLVAVVSNGVVTAVNVISAGSGYTNNPIVVIDPPVIPNPVLAIAPMSFLAFSNLTVSGTYQLQQAVAWYWINLPVSFTATNAFYGKLVAGMVSSGDYRLALTPVPTQAFATPQVLNGFVVGATVTSGGSGYVTVPVVTITGGGGLNAIAMAHISGGVVTSISISNAGIGYTSNPTIQIAQPPAAAISPAVQPVMRVDSSQLATYENYQIQFTPNLGTPWKNWDGGLFTPTNATNSQFLFITNGTGFFQLQFAP